MKKINFLCLVSFILLGSCRQEPKKQIVLDGNWLAVLDISPDIIPFGLTFAQNKGRLIAQVHNAEETLVYDEVMIKGDSLFVTMSIFDSEIKAKIIDEQNIEGIYVRNYVEDYVIPFRASKTTKSRFEVKEKPKTDFSGRWKTVFQDEKGDTYEALGIFSQKGDQLTGTFLTNLGDYRFLEGNASGNTFSLSAFDGSHAFLFKAEVQEDGSILGKFRSGPRYAETFIAVRDEAFELPDAFGLTSLKEGIEKFTFSFPDLNGKPVSLDDEKFRDKVVLVQLFGTWCPNCMDETKFLAPWYEKNKARGVEILALAFESKPDFEYASTRIKKSKEKLNANYTFLIAGESNKEKAGEAMPMLNAVVAFPTLLYIDKKGKIRKIHTGFNGPATGGLFDRWVEEHEALVNKLLGEK